MFFLTAVAWPQCPFTLALTLALYFKISAWMLQIENPMKLVCYTLLRTRQFTVQYQEPFRRRWPIEGFLNCILHFFSIFDAFGVSSMQQLLVDVRLVLVNEFCLEINGEKLFSLQPVERAPRYCKRVGLLKRQKSVEGIAVYGYAKREQSTFVHT
jgi:hypothetical protein